MVTLLFISMVQGLCLHLWLVVSHLLVGGMATSHYWFTRVSWVISASLCSLVGSISSLGSLGSCLLGILVMVISPTPPVYPISYFLLG